MQVYLVGGAVRDFLLGHPYQEKDYVVVGATPEHMLAQGFQPVGKDFPVFLHPQTKEEYALARTERKSGQGYHGFQFFTDTTVSLEDDLIRRDLTINAIAMDQDGKIYDPYGGQSDLENKILRHVSEAFAEDPLRVLRVARFAARYFPYGFQIAPETLQLMQTMAESGELDALTPERVWKETSRALMETHADIYFQTLRDCGALKHLFPEIDALFGVPQRPEYHPEVDCGVHTLMSLQQACKSNYSLDVRFPVLLQRLDVLRRPERVEAFVQACECDAKGRLGLEDRPYPQAQYMREAMQIVRSIKVQDLPENIKGAEIGEMLIQYRIEALAEFKIQHQSLSHS